MIEKEDNFLKAIKRDGYYSNTYKSTKWHDGVDLTIEQNFREVSDEVKENTHIHPLWDVDSILMTENHIKSSDIFNQKRDNHEGRFYHQERLTEEFDFYRKYGCECCGGKLITPTELSYGLCSDCDRRMFSKTRARSAFPELPERTVCCSKELYIFNDRIDEIKVHNHSVWNFLLKLFVRNRKSIERNKSQWNPYLRYIK